MGILAEAKYLSSRGHLHPEDGIGATQAGELNWGFDTDEVGGAVACAVGADSYPPQACLPSTS